MTRNQENAGAATPNRRVRLWRVWFPSLAALGGLGALVAGAFFRTRPAPKLLPSQGRTPGAPVPPAGPGAGRVLPVAGAPAAPDRQFDRRYSLTAVLGGTASPHPWRRQLAGIAVDRQDQIYVLGDDEIRVFGSALERLQSWRAPERSSCLTVGPDGRVYLGRPGRVDVFAATGAPVGSFPTGEKERPADVTAVKVHGEDVLVADAAARVIRRHGMDGAPKGLVGNLSKTGGFLLPNRSLDIAVDEAGVIYATDTGRHQVTTWAINGTPRGKFGRFGMSAPEDFVGCCNPVNLALTPDGKVVTGEKMVARVKVFEPGGVLLGLIGPEHFDQSCIHLYLAVDSRGRILVGDPVRREVKVFSQASPVGRGERG